MNFSYGKMSDGLSGGRKWRVVPHSSQDRQHLSKRIFPGDISLFEVKDRQVRIQLKAFCIVFSLVVLLRHLRDGCFPDLSRSSVLSE